MSDVNYGAIALASVVQMVIGALWYSPVLFSSPWMKAVGTKSMGSGRSMGSLLGVQLVLTLIEAYVLSELLKLSSITTTMGGAEFGFLLGVGIVATAVVGDYLFAGRSKTLYLINLGYNAVGLVAMGAVLGAWR